MFDSFIRHCNGLSTKRCLMAGARRTVHEVLGNAIILTIKTSNWNYDIRST